MEQRAFTRRPSPRRGIRRRAVPPASLVEIDRRRTVVAHLEDGMQSCRPCKAEGCVDQRRAGSDPTCGRNHKEPHDFANVPPGRERFGDQMRIGVPIDVSDRDVTDDRSATDGNPCPDRARRREPRRRVVRPARRVSIRFVHEPERFDARFDVGFKACADHRGRQRAAVSAISSSGETSTSPSAQRSVCSVYREKKSRLCRSLTAASSAAVAM